MRIKEKPNQLILTDLAGGVWALSSLFLIVGGILLYGSLGGFTNWREVSTLSLAFSFFFGAVGLATGFYFMIATPFSKTILNSNSRTVLHRRRGLLATQERIVRFYEISGFFVYEEKDNDGDMYYRVDLRLKDDEIIRLSEVLTPAREQNEELAVRLNKFIC